MEISKETVLALGRKEPAWLRERRLAAWESFASSAPLPFYKYGLSIVTPLEGMEPEEFVQEGNTIHISNPQGSITPSPGGKLFSLFPQERYASLHQAFCRDVLHIRVPDGTELPQPVLLRKTMGGKTFFEHVLIELGKNSKATILETLAGSGGYHSGGVEIFLDEGASLLFGSMQNLSKETATCTVRKAVLQADASLQWVSVDTGSRLALSRVDGRMDGQGSSILTKMMVFGSGSQHFDFNVSSTHAAPDTSSDIMEKAALDGRARMIFNGLVKIQKNAPRASGYQKEDTLLLSPDAEAAPIPSLEIDNNDVRCSHGTTVGQIDRDIIFYLLSRGLDEEAATRMVVRGFFEPLLSTLPREDLQEEIRRIV